MTAGKKAAVILLRDSIDEHDETTRERERTAGRRERGNLNQAVAGNNNRVRSCPGTMFAEGMSGVWVAADVHSRHPLSHGLTRQNLCTNHAKVLTDHRRCPSLRENSLFPLSFPAFPSPSRRSRPITRTGEVVKLFTAHVCTFTLTAGLSHRFTTVSNAISLSHLSFWIFFSYFYSRAGLSILSRSSRQDSPFTQLYVRLGGQERQGRSPSRKSPALLPAHTHTLSGESERERRRSDERREQEQRLLLCLKSASRQSHSCSRSCSRSVVFSALCSLRNSSCFTRVRVNIHASTPSTASPHHHHDHGVGSKHRTRMKIISITMILM